VNSHPETDNKRKCRKKCKTASASKFEAKTRYGQLKLSLQDKTATRLYHAVTERMNLCVSVCFFVCVRVRVRVCV